VRADRGPDRAARSCYVKPGDTLARGQRYGFIRFGSRVDVYLAPTAVPKVAVGDGLRDRTIIALLPTV
jgi:phosphatidylserine decarboxylase